MNYLNRFLKKSGADKEKAAVDLNNPDFKANESATATPRSASPACSTPTHSNVGDTTTDEFESAEEGTPRKLSLTALAEQLDKVHLSTPQELTNTNKPFVFPYSPVEENLLVEEDGRETPLIFSDSVEKLGDSPVTSRTLGEDSAVCNGVEGSDDSCSNADITKSTDLKDPSETFVFKVTPNSSSNELDETLLFNQSTAPTVGSPPEIPDFQESDVAPAKHNETSATEANHANANALIDDVILDDVIPNDLPAEHPKPDIVDNVSAPLAKPPTSDSSLNTELSDNGVHAKTILESVDVDITSNKIEQPVESLSQQVEKLCLKTENTEKVDFNRLDDVTERETPLDEIVLTESTPGLAEVANESSDPVPSLQHPTPIEGSVFIQNPVICISGLGQSNSCISNVENDTIDLNQSPPSSLNSTCVSSASNELLLKQSTTSTDRSPLQEIPDFQESNVAPAILNETSASEAGQANALIDDVPENDTIHVKHSPPSSLNSTCVSSASNESCFPVSIKSEIIELAGDRDVQAIQQCASESKGIPPNEMAAANSPDQQNTIEPNEDQHNANKLPVKQVTFNLDTPPSALTPESNLEKKEDTVQSGCVDGSDSQASLELAHSEVIVEQAANVSISSAVISDGLNTSQLSAPEPEPAWNKFSIDNAPLEQEVAVDCSFSVDEASSNHCNGVVSVEPELGTNNGVDAVVGGSELESDASTLLDSATAVTVDSTSLREESVLPAPSLDQFTSADPLHVNAEAPQPTDASEPAACSIDLNGTLSTSSDVQGSSLADQLVSPPTNVNEILVKSSARSSLSNQVAMSADPNGIGILGPSNSGPAEDSTSPSSCLNNKNQADSTSNTEAAPSTISDSLVDDVTLPNANSSINFDETNMSVSENGVLDETVVENVHGPTQSGGILENSATAKTITTPPAMDSTVNGAVPSTLELCSSQLPSSEELEVIESTQFSPVSLINNSGNTLDSELKGDDEANDIDMNSSHVFNERLNKLMAEGDEACAAPVPSAEVVPTSEKLAKAVKFEDCPPEVLETYHISPKKPAPKKRFSLPATSVANGSNYAPSGLNSTSNGLVNTINEEDDADTTNVKGAMSRRSLMSTSFTINREPQDRPCSSLTGFDGAGPQMSQLAATCSRQEHDLQSDTFSYIQEEAARFAKEFKNDQDGIPNEAEGSSDAHDDSGREEGTFQPATDFDFDFLSQVGGKGKFAANLARKSLYVKFDPLVEKMLASSDDPESELMSNFISKKRSTAEETKSDVTLDETQPEVACETMVGKLIPITPLASKKPTPRLVSQTPTLRQEITRLQDMMLQQEAAHQEKEDLVEKLKRRVRELEAGKNEPVPTSRELEEKDREISALNREIQEAKSNNKQLIQVMEEYEKTISKLVAMKEEMAVEYERQKAVIAAERDEAHQHLANMELAFNDVHQKYERAKVVIETFHANELSLKKNYDDLMDTVKRQKEGYLKFKQHAAETLQAANDEIQRKEREISRMKVVVKKDDLRCKSLQDTLAQKDKEIEELTQICDELIAKS